MFYNFSEDLLWGIQDKISLKIIFLVIDFLIKAANITLESITNFIHLPLIFCRDFSLQYGPTRLCHPLSTHSSQLRYLPVLPL